MDRLEERIRKNRAAFDDQKVDKQSLWSAIEKELPGETSAIVPIWKRTWIRVAAAVAVFVVVGLSFLLNNTGTTERDLMASSQEFADIHGHYEELLQMQIKKVTNSESISSDDKQEFLIEMELLDLEYSKLKKELENNLNNRLILDAIIIHYRKRIELIEKFIQRIERIERKKEPGDEFITI